MTPNGAPIDEVRRAVLASAKAMHARRMVEDTAGNVSGRVDDGTIVLTPSAVSYPEMTLDDLVVVDLDGAVLEGARRATSEKGVHLATLAAHPEVGGVVHCHATHASMYAVAHQPIPAAIDEVVRYVGGDVTVGAYHLPGSDDLSAEVARHLGDRSAVLMANHGLVTVGRSVDDALRVALVVEHNARIVWGAHQLGGVVALPAAAIGQLAGSYREDRDAWWNPA